MRVAYVGQVPANIIVKILLRHFRRLPERNEALLHPWALHFGIR